MDEEKKPKVTIADLAAQGSKASGTQAGPNDTTQKIPGDLKTEYVFYNVMPKTKDGTMTQPTLKIENVVEAEKPESDFFKKYKLYIFGAVAILILGPLIYYLIGKFGAGSYKSDSILINPSAVTRATTSSSTPLSQSGFTTPQDWRDKYFPNCKDPNECGDNADPDQDGLNNLQEYQHKTDPNNPDSDKDGLSDGDEVNIFSSDPLNPHTSGDPQYSDGDYIKGGYDISTGKKMLPQQIAALNAKMKNFSLHQPTLTTLSDVLNSIYNFSEPVPSSTPDSLTGTSTLSSVSTSTATSTLDQSLGAKQDRDTQRSGTVKNIEAGLVKYKSDNQTYPQTNDFGTMFAEVKPYLKVATNPIDPVNQDPYIYSYVANTDGSDFTLTFFSEVAGQSIKKHAADAIKDSNDQEAAILDDQRQTDLENIRTALLLYSQNNVAGNQTYVFPTTEKYKTALVPTYLEEIPKDPKTGADYPYQVSSTFNTFTLKTALDNPPTGTTGYLCNQDECMNY